MRLSMQKSHEDEIFGLFSPVAIWLNNPPKATVGTDIVALHFPRAFMGVVVERMIIVSYLSRSVCALGGS